MEKGRSKTLCGYFIEVEKGTIDLPSRTNKEQIDYSVTDNSNVSEFQATKQLFSIISHPLQSAEIKEQKRMQTKRESLPRITNYPSLQKRKQNLRKIHLGRILGLLQKS